MRLNATPNVAKMPNLGFTRDFDSRGLSGRCEHRDHDQRAVAVVGFDGFWRVVDGDRRRRGDAISSMPSIYRASGSRDAGREVVNGVVLRGIDSRGGSRASRREGRMCGRNRAARNECQCQLHTVSSGPSCLTSPSNIKSKLGSELGDASSVDLRVSSHCTNIRQRDCGLALGCITSVHDSQFHRERHLGSVNLLIDVAMVCVKGKKRFIN